MRLSAYCGCAKKMDGAVKLLRAWKLCSEPESNGGTPEVERLVRADELVWVAA